jgi:Domain of unknown function (DUF5658)
MRLWVTLAYCLVQALDLVTTRIGFAIGLVERNPVAVVLLRRYGEAGLYEAKVATALLLLTAAYALSRRWRSVSRLGMPLVIGITGVAVLGNLVTILAAVLSA